MKSLKICKRCLLDTTINDIWFDALGECKYCKIHDELEKAHSLVPSLKKELDEMVLKVKRARKNKKYDCIAGVSGGRDSTYVLMVVKQLGFTSFGRSF